MSEGESRKNARLNDTGPVWVGDTFSEVDAVGQAQWVREGRVSPLELVEAALTRIGRAQPRLNAVVSIDADAARERARTAGSEGLLAGVPTLLKDLLAYPGLPLELGSRAFAGQRAPGGSEYTRALDRAGLIVLGKSATSELGLLGTTETLAHGPTRNPWNLERSTGGSSGGAVAAVAAGMVPVAHASDGGGSIRGPASLCGVFGFKPSRGRERSTGVASQTPFGRLVSDHCVSRTVRDSAAWLSITEQESGTLPAVGYVTEPLRRRLRIGWYSRTAFDLEPERDVAAALQRTVALCMALGHEVVPCRGPSFDAQAASEAFFDLAGSAMAGMFAQLRRAFGEAFDAERFEPFTRALAERAGRDCAATMNAAVSALAQTERAVSACFEPFDVLLCPTVPFPAFALGRIGPCAPASDIIGFTEALAGYTAVASLAGWCAMSVPLEESPAGLPIGMHFAAKRGDDATLLALAYELEQAAPWRGRIPGIRRVGDGTTA